MASPAPRRSRSQGAVSMTACLAFALALIFFPLSPARAVKVQNIQHGGDGGAPLDVQAAPEDGSGDMSLPEEEEIPRLGKAERIKLGRSLAGKRCSSCHAIGKKGASPNKDAPPFRSFSSMWPLEALEEPLAEGIVTGHEGMPEFVFEPPEIDAFIEYLRSVQVKSQPAKKP